MGKGRGAGYAASAFVCLYGERLWRGCWGFPGRMAFTHEYGGGEDWAAFVFGVWWCGLAVVWVSGGLGVAVVWG